MIIRLLYNGFFTLFFYGIGFLGSLIFAVLTLPCAFLPESVRYENRVFFFLMQCWAYLLVYAGGVRYKITGEIHNLQISSIVLANHASIFDSFLVELALAGRSHIWLSKESFSKIPLISFVMKRINVPIRRENPLAAVRGLTVAYHRVKNRNCSIVLFPEGTRHADGEIHHFYAGFALLARKLQRPIVPIFLKGTDCLLPPKARIVDSYATPVTLVVGPLFHLAVDETDDQFVGRIRQWFVETKEAGKPPAQGLSS